MTQQPDVGGEALPTAASEAALAQVTANFRQYLMGWGTKLHDEEDCDLYRSGLAQPQFNGVVRLRSLEVAREAMASARERLAGVPWWWWAGPDSPIGTPAVLTRLGATPLGPVPLMARHLATGWEAPSAPQGLRIQQVRGEPRLTELVQTYSASMGVSPALEKSVVAVEANRADNEDVVRLAAVLDGQVVGTTVVMMAHGVAGIFLVHVAKNHRRQGIGGALTGAALQAGRDRGMELAALGASPAGEPLYRRCGFQTVSEYHLFAGPA
jgi:GNAT superfamily N-acetyltransferase